MPEDLKVSQIGSSPLPPPFRGLHSPGVRKHCQIIFACYFRKSSNVVLCEFFNEEFKLDLVCRMTGMLCGDQSVIMGLSVRLTKVWDREPMVAQLVL